MEDKLRKLQLTELEILNEFVRICNEHNLQYYLMGGTLLGAVRHKGFIPWDDDIDVIMPRADYDRFADLCKTSLSPDYFYQAPETDPYYYLTYAKLRKNSTEIYEERFIKSKFHKGVFIDIFPLDPCPAPGPVSHLLFNILAVMNYRGQIDSGETYEPYEEMSGRIGYAVLNLFSPQKLPTVRRKILRVSKLLSKGAYIASYSGAYGYRKEVYPSSWFSPGRKILFEQSQYTIPKEAEQVLTRLYGHDYMIPEQKEECIHISVT